MQSTSTSFILSRMLRSNSIINMIGTSTLDFYLIRTCIIGLHYLAPLCTLYCIIVVALYGIGATRYPVPLVVELTAFAETLFYLLTRLHYQAYLQRKASHPPMLSNTKRRELFDLCNENIPDPEAYLSKWFLGAPLDEIKRENLKDFFLWAFFNRDGPPGNDDAELEEYVDAVEQLLRRKIEPGRGSAQCLRLTLDRVDMLHRSLIWYWVRRRLQPRFAEHVNLHCVVYWLCRLSSVPFPPPPWFSLPPHCSFSLLYPIPS